MLRVMTLQSDHSMLPHLWIALGPREIDSKDEKDDLQRTCIGFVIVSSLVLKFAMIEIRSSTLARNHKARLWWSNAVRERYQAKERRL